MKWISTKDYLPPLSEKVLFYETTSNNIIMGRLLRGHDEFIDRKHNDNLFWRTYGVHHIESDDIVHLYEYELDEVTHWCALEPPKEGE